MWLFFKVVSSLQKLTTENTENTEIKIL